MFGHALFHSGQSSTEILDTLPKHTQSKAKLSQVKSSQVKSIKDESD